MSDSILYRDVVGAELRADGDGRTIHGICVPYEQVSRIGEYGQEYDEKFVHGAFARSIAERGHKVKLMAQHDYRRFPVGRATSLVERSDGLYGAFSIPNTRDGDDILELVRSGTLDSFSIGFMPVRTTREGDVTVRHEASLREVSLVGMPAYPGAEIAGVRASGAPHIPRAEAERRLRLINLYN
jgi:HK97 family phage prohead protease